MTVVRPRPKSGPFMPVPVGGVLRAFVLPMELDAGPTPPGLTDHGAFTVRPIPKSAPRLLESFFLGATRHGRIMKNTICDVHESSYRTMGDNLGGGRAEDHWLMHVDNRNEPSNKWGDKAHLRIIAPLPSGANISKTKSATGDIYAPTTCSNTVGAPRPRAQRSYSAA
jgi:hypothetical protein